ncbi:MAG TPA: hypothetical protein VH063_00165 [Gaiellaceae bacterium]|nr:hypothetical protein [Gaiellaceae bacterium]
MDRHDFGWRSRCFELRSRIDPAGDATPVNNTTPDTDFVVVF